MVYSMSEHQGGNGFSKIRLRFIFSPTARYGGLPLHAWRIIQDVAKAIDLEGKISCPSPRKALGYHAWTSGMVSQVVIMHIYNYSSFELTLRYLGVAQETQIGRILG